jgi:hypothetical protein
MDLEEVQFMGFDRPEHLRRQALRKIKCGDLEDPRVDLLKYITCADKIITLSR